ncbi:N-acetyldiaminopimelate deacetylase [Virgibacillus salarius]|uniref:N-acetyldiaminopimelate deacetylase n=1 Tax=Virgibacillus salarius TaxID=447199 RepID=UPI002493CF74|nr:N-acetyldiaminopimelate deacetylase [Virgibacillus salarius]WBX79707.1 N-acetyldiaminopimelate deacetylase [Virgibacillus salarius]
MLELKEIRRDLHQIPELGFQEIKTQQYLLEKIKDFQTDRVSIQLWKTGILVFVAGLAPEKTIGFRADMDGLPIMEKTNLAFSSLHQGKMHACGHDFHMTIGLGALQHMIENPIKDNCLFIFQPAEEGPDGALPLMQSEQFNDWRPDVIFALHIAPELPVGTVSSKPGLLFANTSELYLDFTGKGGHAAYPHLTRDMAVAASSFIVQMQQIVSRNINPLEGAVVTIGKMESGFVQNAIAETARLEGTIRTEHPNAIQTVKNRLEKMAKGFEMAYDCSITLDYGANYYQVYNDHQLVERFSEIIQATDLNYIQADAAMTGEDFGYMLKDIPGFMFWLGVDSEYGLHHAQLNPDEDALFVGVEAVTKTIKMLSL